MGSDAVSLGCLFKQILYRVFCGPYFAGVNIIKQNFSLSCSPAPACLLTNHLISAAPREGSEPDGELMGRRNRRRIKVAALQAAMLAPRAGTGGDVGTPGDSPGAGPTVRPGSQPSPGASPRLWVPPGAVLPAAHVGAVGIPSLNKYLASSGEGRAQGTRCRGWCKQQVCKKQVFLGENLRFPPSPPWTRLLFRAPYGWWAPRAASAPWIRVWVLLMALLGSVSVLSAQG